MIITKNWLEQFINISHLSIEEICKTLNSIGLEVDSVNNISIAQKVVVGKILEKEKHPDADKLNICQVDLGDKIEQIVCGATNVDIGQFVVVATVGAALGDLKIKAAKLRGVESNGMICSSTEIGLPKLNDGIMLLDNSIGELILGKELKDYKSLNDTIIEIGLTPNRGDCLSILGVARELSAYYEIPLIELDKEVNYNELSIGQLFDITSSNIDSFLAYKAINFTNFNLDLITNLRLATIGKLKNNSDIKNTLSYLTHSVGVIFNAYPKDKATLKNELYVWDLKKNGLGFDSLYSQGEILSTIGVEHKDFEEDCKDFLVEASYINPEVISRKVFDTKIKTSDVFYKSSRGSEPNLEFGLDYFANFTSKLGATIYSGTKEFLEEIEKTTLSVSVNKINSIIGEEIDKFEIERILTALDFEIKESLDDILLIKVPLYRHDVKNIADITEEVIRMIGIDKIQAKPLAIDEVKRINKTSNDLIKKNKIRAKAIENGFFETLTYVFTSKEGLEKYGFKTVKNELDLINPIVKELNTYRTTLFYNLVEACSNNFKVGARKTSFFEIGTVFDENRNESKKISFIYSGASEIEDVSNAGKPKNIEFFSFAKKVLNSIGEFDLEPMIEINNDFIHPYQNANILIDGNIVGHIFKLHPNVTNDFDLSDTFMAEVDFESIKNDLIKANPYSKFQVSRKDLSIITPKSIQFKEIKKAIDSLNNNIIKQYNLIDIYSDEKLGDNESLTIRFILQSDEKTLDDNDINSIMNSILDVLKERLSITIR
ncbi:phenylalanine--tRNA ligase subunit beta [Aliarcobacter vitoriensis]|uniref:Phenylalanine--tRNA ligase beta subunit n=1 Tax=Aliarcobacter vitoriensis TaxID=2011099 RepID=A0A366MS76_9BACT|nr:phenylalanine--tRNA ligase subunit beta [Aliarcobacter vitoriensis]RBQ28897.1 phenylalanine--tRNA ligase subunit beta [Aliarcobacter vitoriensis]